MDFVNTVDWRGRKEPDEYLFTYGDLLAWSVHAEVLTPAEAQRLERCVTKTTASAALACALEFREAAYRILSAVLAGRAPGSSDLQKVNSVIVDARAHSTLAHEAGKFTWAFADCANNPNLPLWLVSLSFADLLASEQLPEVHRCGSEECGWLFLDVSKNHKRRWCSMEGCGNRAKARRHYAKTR